MAILAAQVDHSGEAQLSKTRDLGGSARFAPRGYCASEIGLLR